MIIDLLKCHGSGNDFILIDELTKDISFTDDERSKLAISLCNRKGSLGGDGILFVMKSSRGDARMRVFNADGSEASMCGNGLRCVARFVHETVTKDTLVIETMKKDLAVERTEDIFDGIPTFKVEISPVSFRLNDLPLRLGQETLNNETIPGLSDSLRFTALAVPNPHLVSIVEQEVLDSGIQEELAESVNKPNELFPDGVNVSFVKHLGENKIFVRTFERGVGFTNACGTAMSASSLVACLNGKANAEEEIEVFNPGGKVKCAVHLDEKTGEYTIDLIGNATYEYRASIAVDLEETAKFKLLHETKFTKETNVYSKFENSVREQILAFK
ncbi:diaminopimelate epimerase [Actinomycetes bacterium NPDC127524]